MVSARPKFLQNEVAVNFLNKQNIYVHFCATKKYVGIDEICVKFAAEGPAQSTDMNFSLPDWGFRTCLRFAGWNG